MGELDDTKYLRIALLLVGLIFIFGIYPLTIIWPSGWAWHTGGHSDYLQTLPGLPCSPQARFEYAPHLTLVLVHSNKEDG